MDGPAELGGTEHLIGGIVTTSIMTTTKFGDKDLFFRHQALEEDIAIHPEWEPYEPLFDGSLFGSAGNTVFSAGQKISAKCPFSYLW